MQTSQTNRFARARQQARAECPVCLDPLSKGRTVVQPCCGRGMCQPCLAAARRNSPACPLCRNRRVRNHPPPARQTGAEKYRGDQDWGYRNDIDHHLPDKIAKLALDHRPAKPTESGEELVAALAEAREGEDEELVQACLQRIWGASSDGAKLTKAVGAGLAPLLLQIVHANVSAAAAGGALGPALRGRMERAKLALGTLRRAAETRAGRASIMGGAESAVVAAARLTAQDMKGDGDEGDGDEESSHATPAAAVVLMHAARNGKGKVRRLAADVSERLARSSAGRDALFAAGMRPAMVSSSAGVRAAELAKLSGQPVSFRQAPEKALGMGQFG